jgi:Zn ribbon nucleic-acid-binding protein
MSDERCMLCGDTREAHTKSEADWRTVPGCTGLFSKQPSPAALPVSEEPPRCPQCDSAARVQLMTRTAGREKQIQIWECKTCGQMLAPNLNFVAAEEPRREEPDKLLRIAGLVNGYHNDGTKLSAADLVAATLHPPERKKDTK